MSDFAITVQNVSKVYRIWARPAARLTAPATESLARMLPSKPAAFLRRRAKKRYRDFWALKDISFEVRKGEAVGIIGRNGSGKSTLLQIIAGTMCPTEGTVNVNGRVAALLELGSGFNPEFTGRENVYLNAAVLGLTRAETDARFDAIAAFADIGDFVEQPVRTYSSGMVMRLAFSVAAHVDPNLLIIDESLSVGDARFQLKCARAIDRFLQQGVTLLFVSHDSSMVKRLCSRAVLLEGGRAIYAGKPNDVVNLYSKLIADGGSVEALAADIAELGKARTIDPASATAEPTAVAAAAPQAPAEIAPSQGEVATEIHSLRRRLKAMETILNARPDNEQLAKRADQLWADERRHVQVTGQEFSYGGELGRIHEVAILDAESQPRTWFSTGEPVVVRMVVEGYDAFPEPIFALTVKNVAGVEIYGTNTLYSKQMSPPLEAGDRREVTFSFDLNLMPGHYFLSFGFTHFVGEELVVIHRRYDAIKIDVHGFDRTFGIANLRAVIQTRALSGKALTLTGIPA
jgi:ABC-type polysaccharide/polyol phosphate transport system ATPase subunit